MQDCILEERKLYLMRYPKFLGEHGKIGFVAPSLGCTYDPYLSCFRSAKQNFKNMGYEMIEGKNCSRADGIGISAPPLECGEELNNMYLASECDVILSVGGGETMCEVVPYIDFENMAKATPKWFVGYSDNTNFVFLSAVLSDTAAIYGPCVSDFGMEKWHPAVQDTWNLLRGKNLTVHNYDKWEIEKIKSPERPLVGYNPTMPVIIKRFPDRDVKFKGRVIGGSLDCMENLFGTPYDKVNDFCERYKQDGIVWFFESCDLNVFSIRRALWKLKEGGWFKYVRGFLVGRPGCFGEEMFGLNQYTAVTDMLEDFDVPIIMDLDIGHMPPMMPVICGAKAEITVEKNKFSMTYILE